MLLVFKNFNKIPDEKCQELALNLPKSRTEKLNTKANDQDKKICICEYFIVKKLLKLKENLDFSYNENGKPYITGCKQFSISHCDDVLCVCTSKKAIGVDIQKIEYNEGVARLICLENEYKEMDNAKNKAEALTKLFTKKESAIKCLGLNLTYIKDILLNNKFKFKSKRYKNYIITTCKVK